LNRSTIAVAAKEPLKHRRVSSHGSQGQPSASRRDNAFVPNQIISSFCAHEKQLARAGAHSHSSIVVGCRRIGHSDCTVFCFRSNLLITKIILLALWAYTNWPIQGSITAPFVDVAKQNEEL
jgi:hypothetical protein